MQHFTESAFSSKRVNRGLKEFEGQDRAFIIRFAEDNSYVALDYRSPSILNNDLVERLGLAKNDLVTIRCAQGDYVGKIWFMGTNAEVLAQEKVAETIMRRINDGENLNLSEISLTQSSLNKEKENIAPSPSPATQADVDSDSEHELFTPAKKLKVSDRSPTAEKSTAASLAPLVCSTLFWQQSG